MTARLEPWLEKAIADPEPCQKLIEQYGSPLNLHDYASMGRNIAELHEAVEAHEIDFQIYLARKASKTRGAIAQAVAGGCGIDVAGFNERDQCVKRGVPAERLVVSADVKSEALLRLAVEHGVVIGLDKVDEATELLESAGESEHCAAVALQLGSDNPVIPPTGFGLRAVQWLNFLERADKPGKLKMDGIRFYLTGCDGVQRALAVAEEFALIGDLQEPGQKPGFVDMGGGIPKSYLDDGNSGQVSTRRSPNCQKAMNP